MAAHDDGNYSRKLESNRLKVGKYIMLMVKFSFKVQGALKSRVTDERNVTSTPHLFSRKILRKWVVSLL